MLFHGFSHLFPMYPSLITPVCVLSHIVAKISALIPSASNLYLALVSGGVTSIVLHEEEADEQQRN